MSLHLICLCAASLQLDGTTNFVHSFPFVCVSIGLVIKKQVVVGVVHNPILNETFSGEEEEELFFCFMAESGPVCVRKGGKEAKGGGKGRSFEAARPMGELVQRLAGWGRMERGAPADALTCLSLRCCACSCAWRRRQAE